MADEDENKDVSVGEGAEESTTLIAFDLRTLAQFQASGPYVRVLSEIGAARVVLFAFEAGQRLKEHRTSSQILVQVLRGAITFTAGGRDHHARAGTLLQLEADVPHSITAETCAVVVVTMVPSPAAHSPDADLFAGQRPLVTRTP